MVGKSVKRKAAEEQERPPHESHLVRDLVYDFSWGHLSAERVQKYALGALKDHMASLKSYAHKSYLNE